MLLRWTDRVGPAEATCKVIQASIADRLTPVAVAHARSHGLA